MPERTLGEGVSAEFLPANDRFACAEPDIPLVLGRRDGDPVAAAGTHVRVSTGPKSP